MNEAWGCAVEPGLPDGIFFRPKILIWVQFGRVLPSKMFVHFMAIWSILRPFGIFCGHLVYFVAIWSILRPFGLFCGHLVYFVAIWYILRTVGIFFNGYLVHFWPFGIFYGYLVYFFPFGYVVPRKIWQPCDEHE
jgi:hypothetical protein